ncbi:YmaF family protein [Ammoniphilus oxalaticus]
MQGLTLIADGHRHLFSNVTDLLIRIPRGTHRHTFQGITNTTDNHRHAYSGTTGPAINGQGPNHFHRFRIMTQISNGHRHIITGRTTIPMLIRGIQTHGLIIEKVRKVKVK